MQPPDTPAAADRDTMQDRIYRLLREQLMSGVIRPGQPLSIRGISAAVGASAMPVRDALRRLETENAIAPGANRALTVASLDGAALREIRDLRMTLEGMAGERAAGFAGRDLIHAARAAMAAMTDAIGRGDVETYLTANWDFHRRIYAASRMPLLIDMIESLWLRMGPHIRTVAVDIRHFETAMAAHRRILAALEAGDGPGVRTGIEDDIRAAAADFDRRLRLRDLPAGPI